MANSIVNFLLESAIIFSIIFGCVWFIKTVFKKQLSAIMQYSLWGIVIIRLLIPVSMTTEWSPINLISYFQTTTPAVITLTAEPAVQNNIDTVTNYYGIDGAEYGNILNNSVRTTNNDSANSGIQSAQPFQFDWNIAVIYLWMAGIALYTSWLCIRVVRLKRKVSHCTIEGVPLWMRELLSECKWKLDIRREVKIVFHGALSVPSIMGVFHPVLMIPVKLAEEKNLEKMRHVFMHELTHYKRRDLQAIWLLNFLQAIYWFNPMVWLCFCLIRRDMETVCDSLVLKELGTGQRKDYIGTILSFSGKKGGRQVQAALNLNDGCKKMKKRIHGMYLRKKTKGGVKITVIVMACALIFAGFTTGCQPTPDKPVVIGKNDGQLEQKIDQTAAPEKKYDAPATWQDSFFKNKAEVVVDAKVEAPDVVRYPVFSLKPAGFTQEEVDRMVEVLMQGKPMTQTGRPRTKAELTEDLIVMKSELEKKKKDPQSSDNSIQDFEDGIKSLEEMIATAPEKAEIKSSDGTLQPLNGLSQIQVSADLGKDDPATLWVIADAGEAMVQFRNGIRYYECKSVDRNGTAKINTTKEEAIQQSRKLLADMGIDYMDVANVYVGISFEGEEVQKKDIQGYIIDFTRTAEGIVTAYEMTVQAGGGPINGGNDIKDIEDFKKPWFYERITVCIDDTGVTAFEWRGNVKIEGKASENAELMPFDQIQDIFAQQMLIKYAPGDQDLSGEETDYYKTLIKQKYKIDRIILGVQQIAVKDKPGEYMLLPVWKFFGEQGDEIDIEAYVVDLKKRGLANKVIEEIRKNMEQNNGIMMPIDDAFITINAIDGSVIDRGLGY